MVSIFLLIGLISAIISASSALVIASQFEKDQQTVFEKEAKLAEEDGIKKATIKEVEIGWVSVRDTPVGNEIGKVYVGETLSPLDQKSGWLLVESSKGVKGWIFAKYASSEE